MPQHRSLATLVRVAGPWRVGCVALLACYLVSAVWRQDHGYSFWLDCVLYGSVYIVSAACCAARARLADDSAIVWRWFAVGISLYGLGWIVAAHWWVHEAVQPIPSISDVGWISLYPAAFIACVQVLRRLCPGRLKLVALLDVVVAALGIAAVCAWFVMPALAHGSRTALPVTLTNAAYPAGDILLLGLVVSTLLVARFDVPGAMWVLFGAIVVLIFGDSVYLMDVAHVGVAFGTWVNAVGLTAMVAFTLCSGARFVERPTSVKLSWLVHAMPSAAALSSLTILLIRRAGPFAWISSTLAALTIVGAIVRLVCSYYEARALADTVVLARTDELTGLVNRRGFQDAAARRLVEAGGRVAILVVDLDGFKDINDGLGHHTGDELLRVLGTRLACESKAGSLVARIGGDEFAVLTVDDDGEADELAARILAAIRRPFELRGLELRVDASIGIATAPIHGDTLDELLRHADMTMYRAKAAHRGILRYSPGNESGGDALRTIGQLRHALENEPAQLVLHYQPKVDLLSGSLCGVEALVRWQHPERGLLPPAEFLPLAEKAHLMPLLTDRVLEQAFVDMATWTRELRGQAVAVNLPAEAVSDPALVQRVAILLEASGTASGQLQLEITEDFLMADLEGARVVLDELRALGVGISIDDYGTGYSSLAYLRDLPVDELKLDRAFVQPILADQRASAIVRSTIDLAHSLGLRMVAEGIEDVDTWHRLLAMGCDIGQGYLFARPQTGADLELELAAPDSLMSLGGYGASLARSDLPSSA